MGRFGPCLECRTNGRFAIILEERAGCFTILAFVCHVTVSILLLLLTVSRVDLQCVIVAFPCHIRLLSPGNVIFKLMN